MGVGYRTREAGGNPPFGLIHLKSLLDPGVEVARSQAGAGESRPSWTEIWITVWAAMLIKAPPSRTAGTRCVCARGRGAIVASRVSTGDFT